MRKLLFTLAVFFGLASFPGFGVPLLAQSADDPSQVRVKAESGDVKAQVELGLALALGDGIAVDEPKAVDWFRKAAEQGDAAGQYYLGEMYATGRGTGKDYGQAWRWWEKSASQGEPRALFNLGALYLNGTGVKKNEKKAFDLTHQAAEQGLAAAEFGLGSMYAHGRGVKADLNEAVRWYTKAVEQGDLPAMNNLAWLRMNADEPGFRDSTEALNLAQRAVAASHEQEPAFLDTEAMAFYKNLRYQDAVNAERKALALKPSDNSYGQTLDDLQVLAQSEQRSPVTDSVEFFGPRDGATPPRATFTPEPTKPLQNGAGVVVVWVVVGSDGKVLEARIARGVSPDSDRKALDAVRRWTFQPARKDGKPVATKINVEITFR